MADDRMLQGPELVIGLVGATGTSLGRVYTVLADELLRVQYQPRQIHLVELLHEFPRWKDLVHSPEEERLKSHMDAGDECRRLLGDDALAVIGINAVAATRRELTGERNKPAPRTAYVLRSLKHPAEARLLKRVYGDAFLLIAAYAPRWKRIDTLALKIAQSHHSLSADLYLDVAKKLIDRDEADVDKLGQQMRATFALADVFVDADTDDALNKGLSRFIELLFGYQFHTPTREEYGMFHAHAASLRSAALGRQVGAAICNESGDVLALGTNDVPKSGGGLYWSGDEPDRRDFQLGFDTTDSMKRNMLAEILEHLQKADWLVSSKAQRNVNDLVMEALGKDTTKGLPGFGRVRAMNVLEYGRTIHAEMAAITEAARRGVSVAGGIMYVTTFPCHNCARHVVSAGVRRLFYIEPYAKSLTTELHPDAIRTEAQHDTCSEHVSFEPFVGVAPSRYNDLFAMADEDSRKASDGTVIPWDRSAAQPRLLGLPRAYLAREYELSDRLAQETPRLGADLI
jgi:cytidine deaminase